MTLIDQLNAHPRLSRAATSIHIDELWDDPEGHKKTAVRAVIDERGLYWRELKRVEVVIVRDELLEDVDALIALLLEKADEGQVAT